MLLALLQEAAEVAEEAEPSKTLFYVAGGLLAAWAVVLAAIGLSRPAFPGPGGARAVMLLTVLLVTGAMTAAVVTA